MSNYYNLKYQQIFLPNDSIDIGSNTNTFGNLYLATALTVGDTTVDEETLNVPKIISINYIGDNTAADTAGGETLSITGSGFKAGVSVIINGTAVDVVTVSSSTLITFTSPAKTAGSYSLYVVNTDGGTATSLVGIQYSGVPSWTTAAGSLGSLYETQSFDTTISATGNDIPISYSIGSGSLPGGISLTGGNGKISGTANLVNGSTTYNFSILASDYQNQDVSRNFSITVNPDVVTWSSPANGSTYSATTNDSANIALSASSVIGSSISYSATGLPSGLSISGSSITGTYTGTGSSTATITATAAITGKTATRTLNFNVAAPFSISYLTQMNGYIRNDQSPNYTLNHPAGVQAGDLIVLFHCAYTSSGARWVQDAPSGFNFVSYRFDDGDFSNYSSNTSSYRVLPNTNAFTLPDTEQSGGTNPNPANWTTYVALYFRPTRSINSVSVGSINAGLNNSGSGTSYPSGSGQAFPELTDGTSTVSPSGQTAPVIVVGANYFHDGNPPYTISLTSSPSFDGTVTRNNNETGSIIAGYKVYGAGTTPVNHTLTYGPSGGIMKIMNSFWLKVS